MLRCLSPPLAASRRARPGSFLHLRLTEAHAYFRARSGHARGARPTAGRYSLPVCWVPASRRYTAGILPAVRVGTHLDEGV